MNSETQSEDGGWPQWGCKTWSFPLGWQPTMLQVPLGTRLFSGGQLEQATFQIKIAFPPGCHS